MLDTQRIQSGFDVELQLGAQWFRTALQTLFSKGLVGLPAATVITDIRVTMEEEWDLAIEIGPLIVIRAKMEIVGNTFSFTNDFNDDNFSIDLPRFGSLAHPPLLKKVEGDDDHENVMVLLLNLDLRVSPQNESPLPGNEHVERGDPEGVQSFMPNGQHMALGIGAASFSRFANNIWHTSLREPDGSHPLPNADNKKGNWTGVNFSLQDDSFTFVLNGIIPVDILPDPNIEVEINITPKLNNGKLTFELDTDLDIDTGFWGDVLAFTVGAVIALVIGLLTGGALLIPISVAGLGAVIILEIAEFVVGEILERIILPKDEQGNPVVFLNHHEEIVKFAFPRASEDSLSVGFLDAIPSSIPIFVDNEDLLFNHILTVQSDFDEISMNGGGLAVAGKSLPGEVFEPKKATLMESFYEGDELQSLTYAVNGEQVTLDIQEVFSRLTEGELTPPIKIAKELEEAIHVIPRGKICCPCLEPEAIHRKKTVIQKIKFSTGLELKTSDAIALQDAAGLVVNDLQLIHPSNAIAYYRARANRFEEDNFESLPEF